MAETSTRRALLVEDDFLIAMLIEEWLGELGHIVAATADRLDKALELAQTAAIDFALLDLSLAGVRSYPVAAALLARGIRFAFVTGYRSDDIAAAYADAPVLLKPFRHANFIAIIDRLLAPA